MEDRRDPSYTLLGKRPAPRPRDPADVVWTLRREGMDWTGELVFRDETYGWEARVLRRGELVISQRLFLREPAIGWANDQKQEIERGWKADE